MSSLLYLTFMSLVMPCFFPIVKLLFAAMIESPEQALARIEAKAARNRAKNRRNSREWQMRNPDQVRENNRLWRLNNPDKIKAYSGKRTATVAKRRALKIEAVPRIPSRLSPVFRYEIEEIYEEARAVTEITGLPHHVDHIFPLSKGGAHAPWNLRVLLGSENQSKKDKWPKGEPTHVMWHGELVSRLIG